MWFSIQHGMIVIIHLIQHSRKVKNIKTHRRRYVIKSFYDTRASISFALLMIFMFYF